METLMRRMYTIVETDNGWQITTTNEALEDAVAGGMRGHHSLADVMYSVEAKHLSASKRERIDNDCHETRHRRLYRARSW